MSSPWRVFQLVSNHMCKLKIKVVKNVQKKVQTVYLCLVTDGSVNEDVVITKPFGNGRMTCREIRRNSAGCLKFRDECQKCKEIQNVGKITL